MGREVGEAQASADERREGNELQNGDGGARLERKGPKPVATGSVAQRLPQRGGQARRPQRRERPGRCPPSWKEASVVAEQGARGQWASDNTTQGLGAAGKSEGLPGEPLQRGSSGQGVAGAKAQGRGGRGGFQASQRGPAPEEAWGASWDSPLEPTGLRH